MTRRKTTENRKKSTRKTGPILIAHQTERSLSSKTKPIPFKEKKKKRKR